MTIALGRTGLFVAISVFAVAATFAPARAQSQEPAGTSASEATLQGYVRDSTGAPVANATVSLEFGTGAQTVATSAQIAHTNSEGAYRFAGLRGGAYTLRAEMKGYVAAALGPVSLATRETKKIDLTLVSPKVTGKPAAQAPEFFDEPQFTVAGVTQATNSGGHGSDTVLRTSEALAKATVSLSKDRDEVEKPSGGSNAPTSAPTSSASSAATESSLREAEARNPADPALHHQLGDVEEKLGHPLEAVREYQRAAELDPSEPNLFDWGTELLTHRALEPATEVFTKGNRLFPESVRMLVALGVAWYARGSYDQAVQCVASASDLAPGDPTPYLFLGRMQSVESSPSEESAQSSAQSSAQKLARFAELQPDNALANYYYAVSLLRQSWQPSASAADGEHDNERSARVESLLLKAVRLDPKLGEAYLQLGILYSQRSDFSRAISAYQKAIAVSPEEGGAQIARPQIETLEEAHYRLAQAYLRTGDKDKAQEELKLHDQLAMKTKEDTARERSEIQQFVISLRSNNSTSQ